MSCRNSNQESFESITLGADPLDTLIQIAILWARFDWIGVSKKDGAGGSLLVLSLNCIAHELLKTMDSIDKDVKGMEFYLLNCDLVVF